MKCAPCVFALVAAACSGDRHPPEPPPDPTEPFEDPVTTAMVSSAVGATGPVMQNPSSMVAKGTESTTASGGTVGLPEPDSSPHAPEALDGIGGVGAMTGATLGSTSGGSALHSVSSDGKIR